MRFEAITFRIQRPQWSVVFAALAIAVLIHPAVTAQTKSLDFFESRIRPVLVERCYPCHNSFDTAEGDLAMDWRGGIRSKSNQGTAVVPSKPEESLLLKVIRHEIGGLEMPSEGPKLSPRVIADFEKWIADGAVDPRASPPTLDEFQAATSWQAKLAERKQWWSFQPVAETPVPPPTAWSNHPIDRFVAQKHVQQGLTPAPPASKLTLIRRLAFALTGLPPTGKEIDRFVNDSTPDGYANVVDYYLNSPRFGERWARHWMDLVRYADSHGSEGDPAIPHAYQYRDYLIRALNDDVPYDQLLLEHLAGDLISSPRINESLGINESAIGPAHLRLVFHGFAPTDALAEKVRFTDDQINVFGKAFLGLTISCARCHDHKFDAISQADYYALFGVFGSCRPAMRDVNRPELQHERREQLMALKQKLRGLLAEHWLAEIPELESRLEARARRLADNETTAAIVSAVTPWIATNQRLDEGVPFPIIRTELLEQWKQAVQQSNADRARGGQWYWDLSEPRDYDSWHSLGNGLAQQPSPSGQFTVVTSGDEIIDEIHPAGVSTHGLSTRHRGVLGSPRISLDDKYRVWLQVIGGGGSTIRYVVQDYPRDGTVYPINQINRADWRWHPFDLSYWQGDQIHLELATARDAPLKVGNQDRSWFGIRKVIVRRNDQPEPYSFLHQSWEPLVIAMEQLHPQSRGDLVECYQMAIRTAIQQWQRGKIDDATSLFLNDCLRQGLLSNSLEHIPNVRQWVNHYREMESNIPVPTRVPGVAESEAYDQPLMLRGNHKQPQQPVRRRFLEAIDGRPFDTKQSGRLELARALLQPENPLTSRVIVNRIWHHLFGQGIVATPDNFGKLGATPTHPELLDFLAQRMRQRGWSIKDMIRFVVMSQTWKQSSAPSASARSLDPGNQFLSHANIRRLDAESIRDSLLAVSGELEYRMFGPPSPANSDSRRRSVYIQSRRNSLDSFLNTFDSPVPFSTTGRRQQTNVPAQSLTLLNDPWVMEQARALAGKVPVPLLKESNERRIAYLFRRTLGRKPNHQEAKWLSEYVTQTRQRLTKRRQARQELEQALAGVSSQIDAILDAARTQQLRSRTESPMRHSQPAPVSQWIFSQGLQDQVGKLHGKPFGDARISADGLVVSGAGFVATEPLSIDLQEKTLEVWLLLASTDQRGGGAMTIQDLQGNMFDSIVFGEQVPGQWLAGSDLFRRTQGFDGVPENKLAPNEKMASEPVQLAITYARDGTIRGYRNGRPYGKSYRIAGLAEFSKQQSQLLFGMRHGTVVTPGRMLQGTLIEARLYDRPLKPDEIAASAQSHRFVSRQEIMQSLSEAVRQSLERLEKRQSDLQSQISQIGMDVDENQSWIWLAHALLNSKEFIYIR